jgi:uncharacterized protein YdhG (YjbR/CyaY superfamily)
MERKMKAYASFDDYLQNQSARHQDIIRVLRKFVKRVEPGLREAVKWWKRVLGRQERAGGLRSH